MVNRGTTFCFNYPNDHGKVLFAHNNRNTNDLPSVTCHTDQNLFFIHFRKKIGYLVEVKSLVSHFRAEQMHNFFG